MAGEFELCSISFAAGALVSAFVKADYIVLQAGLGIASAAIVCLALCPERRGFPRIALLITAFAALGACSLWSAVVGWTPPPSRQAVRRAWLSEGIDRLPFSDESNRELLRALLCGDKSGLDRQLKSDFRTSGASHVLALSGLHLGIICSVAGRLTSLLGGSRSARTVSCLVPILLSILYADATGWSPSITRAVLFVVFKQSASLMPEREGGLGRCWFFALMVQLAVRPLEIASAGFWLSYSAMLGIITVLPGIRALYNGRGLPGWLWNAISTALSCQLFTAPLTYFLFGNVPLYFMLTNVIAVPLTEGIIVTSLICLGAGALGLDTKIPCSVAELLETALRKSMEIISDM